MIKINLIKSEFTPTWIIYKHTCIINGKYYVGQTKTTIGRRWSGHLTDAFNSDPKNKKYKYYFSNAIRKYGKENWKHEIIEENIKTQDLANEREIFWIAEFKSNIKEFGYNQTSGGGQFSNFSEEALKKMSVANIGNKARLGKTQSFENRLITSKNSANKKISDEQVLEIIDLINDKKLLLKEIAKMYNVSPTCIGTIKNHKNRRMCIKVQEKEIQKFIMCTLIPATISCDTNEYNYLCGKSNSQAIYKCELSLKLNNKNKNLSNLESESLNISLYSAKKKISDKQVFEILEMIKNKVKIVNIAKQFNVSTNSIRAIKNGERTCIKFNIIQP